MSHNYKAFVSSTFVDLKEHRARVIEALRKSGIFVDPMEDWTADTSEPKEVSVDRMRGCDLCILLVAARRGHVPEDEVLSITQMEVQAAVKRGIDVIPFLYDGEGAWPPKYYELDEDEELRKWRAELKEHTVAGFFTNDPASLEKPVRDALARWFQKQSWPEAHKVYLDTLRKAHSSIHFLGLGYYRDIQDRPINELFVEPRIAPQHISTDTSPEQWPETEALGELLAREKRLVLLGDPGSGKSTLVSWMVWNLTREGNNKWKKALGNPTPFVLVVRELSLENVHSWDDLLAAYFEHLTARLLGRPRYADDIRALFEKGKAMILLDGLDEISNRQVQERLREAVWEGMQKYEGCRWLLTSRVVGYLNYHVEVTEPEVLIGTAILRNPHATLHYMAPFADNQIKKFSRNWFSARDQSDLRARADADKLYDAIQANPYTLRLARTPNLLTMMALIHRERARLPHGRALLYTDIAKAYLESIDENRHIERLGYGLRDQKQWLGRIGFEMQRRRGRQEGRSKSKEILVEGRDVRQWVMTAMRDTGREADEVAAAAFLDEIARRSGLLLPRGEDQFAFTHLSFQEFFAAVFLLTQFVQPPRPSKRGPVEGAGHDDLRAYAAAEVWQETVLLLVELMVAEQPPWLVYLLDCLFGEDFSDIVPEPATESADDQDKAAEDETYRKATLLARLVINPHAGLGEHGLKSQVLNRCCVLEVRRQQQRENFLRIYSYRPHLLRVLFGADQDERPEVRECLADALRDAGIKAFSLNGVPIEDLSPLSGLTGLQVLKLSNTPVSDVSVLSGLTGLEVLDLSNTPVSDVSVLSGLTGLKALNLDNTPVSDVSVLSGLTGLKTLNLDNTPVSDVSVLSGLTGLQALHLSNTQVSDVSGLSGLTGLKTLFLQNTQVSDVSVLSGLTGLQALHLSNTQVSEEGVRQLREALPQCDIDY